MLSKIFVIALIVGVASAADSEPVMTGSLLPKPAALAHKEGCYIEEINDVIPFGHSVTVGHCLQVTCRDKWTEYFACGTASFKVADCRWVEDLSKPYPGCCPKLLQCRPDRRHSI